MSDNQSSVHAKGDASKSSDATSSTAHPQHTGAQQVVGGQQHGGGKRFQHQGTFELGSSLSDLRTKHPPTNNRLKSIRLQELKIHISRFS